MPVSRVKAEAEGLLIKNARASVVVGGGVWQRGGVGEGGRRQAEGTGTQTETISVGFLVGKPLFLSVDVKLPRPVTFLPSTLEMCFLSPEFHKPILSTHNTYLPVPSTSL